MERGETDWQTPMNRGCLASYEPLSHECVTNIYANLLIIVLKRVLFSQRDCCLMKYSPPVRVTNPDSAPHSSRGGRLSVVRNSLNAISGAA